MGQPNYYHSAPDEQLEPPEEKQGSGLSIIEQLTRRTESLPVQFPQQPLASAHDIVPCRIEIACVPGKNEVFDFAEVESLAVQVIFNTSWSSNYNFTATLKIFYLI